MAEALVRGHTALSIQRGFLDPFSKTINHRSVEGKDRVSIEDPGTPRGLNLAVCTSRVAGVAPRFRR